MLSYTVPCLQCTLAALTVAFSKNENVERVRRAHLNDLENVLIFLALSLFFVGTNPDYDLAWYHFVSFTAARIGHTIFYLFFQAQPWRAIAFFVGMISTVSIAVRLVLV